MKNRKWRRLPVLCVSLIVITITALTLVIHFSSARNAEEEYLNAFGMQPPEGPGKDRIAQRQAPKISRDLQALQKDREKTRDEYRAFRDDAMRNHPELSDDDPVLLNKRERYQEWDEAFENACWAAHFYKIPAVFPASCGQYF